MLINELDNIFGKWTVIDLDPRKAKVGAYWVCECICGKVQSITANNLRRGLTTQCSTCASKEATTKSRKESILVYLTQVKNAAKHRKIDFDLDLDYAKRLFLEQQAKCAFTGWAIGFPKLSKGNTRKGFEKATASLDRIDSKKGYIEGNVQWLHKDVNKMKLHYPQEYFIKACSAITNNVQPKS